MKSCYTIALAIITLLATGCGNSKNGEYIIYKTAPHHPKFINIPINPPQEAVRTVLDQHLLGKRITLDFQNDYLITKGIFTGNELLFQVDTGVNNYYAHLTKGDAKFDFYLRENLDTLMLYVRCDFKDGSPMIIPAQLGEALFNVPRLDPSAITVCYLTKNN